MSVSATGPEYRGSVLGLGKQMLAAVLPIAAAVSYILFGPLGGRVFLISLVIVPVILLFAWFVARIDRVRFDDAERVVRRTLRAPVPYDRIKRVRFVESLGVLQSVAETDRRTELLTVGLAAGSGKSFRRAIRERCEGVKFETRGYAAWRLTAVAIVVLASAAFAGSHYLERKFPAVATACASPPDPGAPSQAGPPIVREGQGITVSVPRELERVRFSVGEMTRVRQSGRAGRLFLRAAGFGTEFELLRYAACSRFGVIPGLLKGVLLSRWQNPSVYSSSWNGVHTLLIAGSRDGKPRARILLYNELAGVEALIALDLSAALDLPALASLLPQFQISRADDQ